MKTNNLQLIAMTIGLALSPALFSQAPQKDSPLLVSTEWLEENITDSLLIILHSGMKTEYRIEHIPGSRYVSIWDILVKDKEGLRHEIPGEAELEKVLRSWGIHNDSKIIICYQDGNAIPMAARLFYTLDYAGLGGQTAMLNGGLKAWKEEGRALTSEVLSFKEGTVNIRINEGLRITRKEVQAKLEQENVLIVDARPYERYAGIAEDQSSSRQGHIPGAVNIPYFETTREDTSHMFKPSQDLHLLFSEHLQDQNSLVITYCGTGIWASPLYFAARLLDYQVRFYDGSFQDWEADKSLPVSRPY
jgi:thiosulfate/3-mercaptopyruvate sulfurtransferase